MRGQVLSTCNYTRPELWTAWYSSNMRQLPQAARAPLATKHSSQTAPLPGPTTIPTKTRCSAHRPFMNNHTPGYTSSRFPFLPLGGKVRSTGTSCWQVGKRPRDIKPDYEGPGLNRTYGQEYYWLEIKLLIQTEFHL